MCCGDVSIEEPASAITTQSPTAAVSTNIMACASRDRAAAVSCCNWSRSAVTRGKPGIRNNTDDTRPTLLCPTPKPAPCARAAATPVSYTHLRAHETPEHLV